MCSWLYAAFDAINLKKAGDLSVVVQDASTKEVLTPCLYKPRNRYILRLQPAVVVLQQVARQALDEGGGVWQHPAHKDILVDCDSDAVIYVVEPTGPRVPQGRARMLSQRAGLSACYHRVISWSWRRPLYCYQFLRPLVLPLPVQSAPGFCGPLCGVRYPHKLVYISK